MEGKKSYGLFPEVDKGNHKLNTIGIKLMYIANIIVAGWISITALFYPRTASTTIFTDAFEYSESIRLVGALWFAIFILSIIALFYPRQMSLVLLFQLIYKSSWLIFAALPAILKSNEYPKATASFFLIWICILPFVIR